MTKPDPRWRCIETGSYRHADGSEIHKIWRRGGTNRLGVRWQLVRPRPCTGELLGATLREAKELHAEGQCGTVRCQQHRGPCRRCFKPVAITGDTFCGGDRSECAAWWEQTRVLRGEA